MQSMIVEYDLCSPGRDYDDLIKKIKSYTHWARITQSTWFIKTSDSCATVRDTLMKYMDNNDRLFVGGLTGVAAWHNVICDSNYLKEHLGFVKKSV